jgi:predicted  nucleic acid-binding Zn-ribbon protein
MISEMSAALSSLHTLLLQLAEAESALAEGPRSVAVAEKQITQCEQQIDQQKETIKATRKTADELNLKLRMKEADLAKLQGQLNTASSNKEFDIIKGQIDHAQKDRSKLEETALEAMEAIDAAQARLKGLEADLRNRRNEAQEAKASFESRKAAIDASIAALQSQISEAEKLIPADARANYLRLRKAHGASAIAELEDDFCGACSGRVTAQDMVRIRMSDFICCRGCGRILYVNE